MSTKNLVSSLLRHEAAIGFQKVQRLGPFFSGSASPRQEQDVRADPAEDPHPARVKTSMRVPERWAIIQAKNPQRTVTLPKKSS